MNQQNKKILVASFQSLTAQSGSGMARLGFYISQELQKRNILDYFVVFSKGKYKTDFPSSPVSFWSRYILYAINKLNKLFNFQPYAFRFFQEKLYDWLFVQKVNKNIGILLVTQPYLERSFKKAKKLGIPIVFIPGNPEENYIKKLVLEERAFLNISGEDAYTYKKRIDYYNRTIQYVDNVIGTYPTVYTSYKDSNYKGKITELIGHIRPDLIHIDIEPKIPTAKTYTIGYLAHTVALKGLQYLFQAWDMINKEQPDLDIKLIIAGKIDDSISSYVESQHKVSDKIELMGHVSYLPDFYKSIDVFVVPSLIDGGPYTALEAAHYAVPVIITENCGSAELLSRGNSGCKVVPIRDANALKKEILWAYNHREEAIKVGENAKHNLDTYRMDELVMNICNYLEQELKKVNSK